VGRERVCQFLLPVRSEVLECRQRHIPPLLKTVHLVYLESPECDRRDEFCVAWRVGQSSLSFSPFAVRTRSTVAVVANLTPTLVYLLRLFIIY
jgi:hypothetical protein